MTNIIEHQKEYMSFVAGATIPFGSAVMLSAAGKVVIATGSNWIGVADNDESIRALNSGDSQYLVGDMVNVILEGPVQELISGGPFSAGNYVKADATAGVVVEATATTRTVNTKGIALEAGVSSGLAQIMRLK